MVRHIAALVLALSLCAARAGEAPLAIAAQGSFFVGGHEVRSDQLATVPNFSAEGTITVDQVYVHYQVPATPSSPWSQALAPRPRAT